MQLVRQHSDDIVSKASNIKATKLFLNKFSLELMLTVIIGLAALMAFSLILPLKLAFFTYESDGLSVTGILLTFVVLTAAKASKRCSIVDSSTCQRKHVYQAARLASNPLRERRFVPASSSLPEKGNLHLIKKAASAAVIFISPRNSHDNPQAQTGWKWQKRRCRQTKATAA